MIDEKRERNAQKDVQERDGELHSAVGGYGARRRHGIFLSYFDGTGSETTLVSKRQPSA
jgi:hypothetical protein